MPSDIEKLDPRKYIIIKGAGAHNLKNIDLALPHDKFIVLTGLSGSGKSSLAFDTHLRQKGSAGTWRAFLRMPGSFLDA